MVAENISGNTAVFGPYTDIRVDNTPPAVISDLTALAGTTDGMMNLLWTAPGDDETSGPLYGTYLIKISTSYISTAVFDSITNNPQYSYSIQIATNGVVPATFAGITPSTRHYSEPGVILETSPGSLPESAGMQNFEMHHLMATFRLWSWDRGSSITGS